MYVQTDGRTNVRIDARTNGGRTDKVANVAWRKKNRFASLPAFMWYWLTRDMQIVTSSQGSQLTGNAGQRDIVVDALLRQIMHIELTVITNGRTDIRTCFFDYRYAMHHRPKVLICFLKLFFIHKYLTWQLTRLRGWNFVLYRMGGKVERDRGMGGGIGEG